MADNFDITQGAGKTIRAIDPGTGQLQQVIRLGAAYSGDGVDQQSILSANSTNATSVHVGAADVFGWDLYNTNAAVRWLKFYDKASAPTVGSDAVTLRIGLKPGDHSSIILPWGWGFSLGLAFALTTGVADSDTGAVAANEITGCIFWNS